MPPLSRIESALCKTTERLARELARPGEVAPDWSEFEWLIARAVAAMHGISALLAGELRWRGPDGWTEFLSQQREHIGHRHRRLQELLDSIAERCGREGIPVLALKGAALHLEGLYRQGERPMADLDLLTPPQYLLRAAEVLEGIGLREAHRTFKHRVFEARNSSPAQGLGEHADNKLKVELHERICEPLPLRLTDISKLVSPAGARPGLNPYPSRAALMAHLLLHAAGGMAYRTLRLIQLHDIALLTRRLALEDWQQLLEWRPWWAWPPLLLTERYYGASPPRELASALRACCPVILRRTCGRQHLSDISLSRLWLEAFPGIEWAHSIGEVVTYVARRLVPNAEVRADRRFALITDPALAQGDWGGLSQSRRILRALSARTPRPWPLYAVRLALGESRPASGSAS
jgi:hypothetical protein